MVLLTNVEKIDFTLRKKTGTEELKPFDFFRYVNGRAVRLAHRNKPGRKIDIVINDYWPSLEQLH